MVARQQPLFLVGPREAEEDERRTEQDGDDSGRVGPVRTVEEGLLRRGRDLTRVLGILLRDLLGAREGLRELGCDAVGDLLLVRRGGDRRADRRRVAGGEQRAEIDCMIAPPRSRWRSAVPEAIPARCTGTDPVSECEAGVPANPTPIPTREYASAMRQ